MPSSISHALVAVALGSALSPRPHLRAFLCVGAACAVLPDVDAIGRLFSDVPPDVTWLGGHRGFTHSIAAAVLTGVISAVLTLTQPSWVGARVRFALFIVIATAAHGALDAFTTIGAETTPVQFFSPFSSSGYTSPWKPITGPFSELFLCILPLLAITCVTWHLRGFSAPELRQRRPTELHL